MVISLDIQTESFDNYFNESSENASILSRYLSDKHSSGSSVFFSCKKWTDEVEFEDKVEVEDEVHENSEDSTDKDGGPPVEALALPSDESKPIVENSVESPPALEVGEEKPASDMGNISNQDQEVTAGEDSELQKKNFVVVKRTEIVERCVLYVGLDSLTADMNDKLTVYFIRSTDGEVPKVADSNEGRAAFSEFFEFGVLTGDAFYGIANLMHQVYVPVVNKGQVQTDETGKSLSVIDETLRHELGTSINKFEQQLRHVVQTSRGDVRLTIPGITIVTPELAADDPLIVEEIERAVEEWTVVINAANEAEQNKPSRSQKQTPLGEIEFWRERSASLSALYEQIGMPRVQQMLQVMKIKDSPQLGSFHFHFGELSKTFLEAKDNVKFLTTVERHFRHMTDGSFQTILESMQSMMNGLRMVWVISRHYNSDDRMAPLMETIATTLARRVKEGVKLSEVLAMEPKAAKRLVIEARAVLTQWSENYFRMRKRIEDSGSDHRWEFERKALFGKTDYMSEICANVLEILEALDHFKV